MNENYDNFKSYFTNEDEFNSWDEIVKDILNNEEFKKRVYFKHHEKQSLYTHSLLVSIFAYKYAKKHHADYKVCAIAGLLHDFYTHAWQYSKDLDNLDKKYSENLKKKKKFSTLHAFIHPYEALINSNTYFNNLMNERVENAILVHMFPLSLFPIFIQSLWPEASTIPGLPGHAWCKKGLLPLNRNPCSLFSSNFIYFAA